MFATIVGVLVLLIGLLVASVALLGTSEDEPETAERSRSRRSSTPGPADGGLQPDYEGSEGPPQLADHWHAAFGINVCGDWYPDLYDVAPDYSGIHTHEDGVIHVHPFSATFTGERAVMGAFFMMVDVWVEEDVVLVQSMDLTPRTGRCGDEPGRWVMARFAPDVSDEVVELVEDPAEFASIRFLGDREAFTLAWLPEGETVPPPPSVPMLDRLSDVPPFD